MNVILLVVLCSIQSYNHGDYDKCAVYYGGSFDTKEECGAAAVASLHESTEYEYLSTEDTIVKAGCLEEVNLK